MSCLKGALLLALGLAALAAGPVRAGGDVTIGYQLIYNPWKVAIASGAIETATGRAIKWRAFESGAQVIGALALGEVQIALAGSSPAAAGISRGLDIEVIWVAEDIASAEALVARDGSGVAELQDLRGKRIGVPFASTTHFHTLFALEHFGIPRAEVSILNMQPSEIVDAWEKGEIDAAFVWDPALGRIKKTGRVLITSGELSALGKATFDGLVASRDFTGENPGFMCRFIKAVAAADDAYRHNTAAWTADSDEVAAIVGLAGGEAADVPGVLALYRFPTLAEQVSDRWLGGGAGGGVARALKFTAEFLRDEKKIHDVLPDYSPSVNPRWAKMVLDGDC